MAETERHVVSVEQVQHSLEKIPEERRDELLTILVSHEMHSGPIPSAKALAGYEVVSPGLGREIVDMASREQAHDHDMQQRVLRSETTYRLCTLLAATFVVGSMVTGSVILGLYGHETPAYILGAGSGLTLIAGAFIKGRDLYLQRSESKGQTPPTPPQNEGKPLSRSTRRRKVTRKPSPATRPDPPRRTPR